MYIINSWPCCSNIWSGIRGLDTRESESKYIVFLLNSNVFPSISIQPFLLASIAIEITNHVALAQGFGRRLGLADFATNDLLRHARASTSSEEADYPSIEGRQLPYPQQAPSRQRALRPILRKPSSKSRPASKRNRPNREEPSNFVRVGIQDKFRPLNQRRYGNSNIWYTKRFGPNDGFTWPNDFGSFNIDHNTNKRSGLDQTLGYFSSALRLLSYLVRKMLEDVE